MTWVNKIIFVIRYLQGITNTWRKTWDNHDEPNPKLVPNASTYRQSGSTLITPVHRCSRCSPLFTLFTSVHAVHPCSPPNTGMYRVNSLSTFSWRR